LRFDWIYPAGRILILREIAMHPFRALLAATACAACCAQALQVKEVTPLRVIDKAGAKVGNHVWSLALPEVGVGNVVFAAGPLPYGKEAEYKGIATRFEVATTPALYARVYLPGTVESMIALIQAKNPGFRFNRKFEMVAIKEPGAGSPRETRSNTKLGASGMGMSTHWSQFWPKNEYSLDVPGIAMAKKGEHELRLTVYLEFDTGKTRLVTEMRDGKLVTETVPILRDVAVAHGTCVLVNP
jgi:hypothetical protein